MDDPQFIIFIKNHRHSREGSTRSSREVKTEKFSLEKRSSLNVLLPLNMSFETFFRDECEIASA